MLALQVTTVGFSSCKSCSGTCSNTGNSTKTHDGRTVKTNPGKVLLVPLKGVPQGVHLPFAAVGARSDGGLKHDTKLHQI